MKFLAYVSKFGKGKKIISNFPRFPIPPAAVKIWKAQLSPANKAFEHVLVAQEIDLLLFY